jgi:hypothetical protein
MAYCETSYIYERLRELLLAISDGRKLNKLERSHLKQLLDEWDDILCPEQGCNPQLCPFGMPEAWVEFHGWPNLHALIEQLDQSKSITRLPQGHANPPQAQRRPGHFGP